MLVQIEGVGDFLNVGPGQKEIDRFAGKEEEQRTKQENTENDKQDSNRGAQFGEPERDTLTQRYLFRVHRLPAASWGSRRLPAACAC
jgi:hypothetical protein